MFTKQLNNGLIFETLIEGDGPEVKVGDFIAAHYEGSLLDGKIFDSSYQRGEPFVAQIGVGELIQGWDLAIPGVKQGSKIKLTVPPELAYGSMSLPGIPANSTLVFVLEIVQIMPQKT